MTQLLTITGGKILIFFIVGLASRDHRLRNELNVMVKIYEFFLHKPNLYYFAAKSLGISRICLNVKQACHKDFSLTHTWHIDCFFEFPWYKARWKLKHP
jgi:hypothetical protein